MDDGPATAAQVHAAVEGLSGLAAVGLVVCDKVRAAVVAASPGGPTAPRILFPAPWPSPPQ